MTARSGILRRTLVVLAIATTGVSVPPAVASPSPSPSPSSVPPPADPLGRLAVVTTDDDAVRVRVADETDAAMTDPAGVVLHAEERTAVADGTGGLPDWDTTNVPAGASAVSWTLDSVQGPGRFQGYTVEDGHPVSRFDSAAPETDKSQTYAMPAGGRGDFGWVFDTPGRYRVAFTVSATLASGHSASTPAVYTVDVSEAESVPTSTTSPAAGGGLSVPEQPRAALAEPVPAAAPQAQDPVVTADDTASGRVVLGEGHVDALAPRVVDGRFQIQIKDSTQAGKVSWRRPSDVVFQVRPAARFPLPANDKLSFAGKPGDLVYLIPQVQQDGVIWAGWSTEALTPQQIAGPVTYTLTSVDGPAPVAIFTTGTFGDEKLLLGNAPGTPTTMQVPLATHAHANWIFPKDGIYRLTFTLTAQQAGGGTYTDTQTYGFAVGNADPAQAFGAGAGTGDTGGTVGMQGQQQSGSDGTADSRTGELAYTGTSAVLPLGAGGVLLVVGGIGFVFFANRRRARVGGDR